MAAKSSFRLHHQNLPVNEDKMLETPFVVLVDSLEKIPFSFSNLSMPHKGKMQPMCVRTREVRLPNNSGDYMVEGIDDITVERKSLEDLYGTLANREAFEEQIEWMNFAFRFSAVVIEASWDEVCDPSKFATPIPWSIEEGFALIGGDFDGPSFFIDDDKLGTFTATQDGEIIYQGRDLADAINACERRHTDELWRSKLNPVSVVETINSWKTKYPRVHWEYPGGRRQAELMTFSILRHAWRHRQKRTH